MVRERMVEILMEIMTLTAEWTMDMEKNTEDMETIERKRNRILVMK